MKTRLTLLIAGLLLPVVASAQNRPPVADAGPDQEIFINESTTLFGSATDADNDPIRDWLWTVESAPAGSTPFLPYPDLQNTQFIGNIAGTYVISLIASDGIVWSEPDYVTITVVDLLPPVAVAEATPISGQAPLTVQFDGSASRADPHYSIQYYSWDFDDWYSDPSDEVSPSHTYTTPGIYTASLHVLDEVSQGDADYIQILVASHIVSTNADSGPGSLRQAIADAGTNWWIDVIGFTNTLSGQTIKLTSGQLYADKHLTIDASTLPDGIVIDGNGSSRIFEFAPDTFINLTGLTLTNGAALDPGPPNNVGGAILVNSNAMILLTDCTLVGNSATYGGGALYNGSGEFISIHDSTFSGNTAGLGGAIYDNQIAFTYISRSTLSNNSANSGGAIYCAGGTNTLNSCTVASNTASNSAGGIYIFDGDVRLSSSTFSSNLAATNGGAIYCDMGSLALNNSTLSANSAGNGGGGIRNNSGSLTLTNTIVAGNLANTGTNIYGSFSGSNNLIDVDPMLASLGHYGGSSQTMPPLPGSPAIGAGLNTGSLPSTDQRGYARVIGSAVDIGAVEVQNALTVVNNNDSGFGSLRETIGGLSFEGGTVTFHNSLYGQTILLIGGQLFVDKNLTIDATSLPDGIAIDGNGSSRIFEFASGTTNVLRRLTLTHGYLSGINFPSNAGGAILVSSNAALSLTESVISSNSATLGGAICNAPSSTTTLNDCALRDNHANDGGAIYNKESSVTLIDSTLSGNNTSWNGGGILTAHGTSTLTGSLLSANRAEVGGGIYNSESSVLTLTSSTLAGNSAVLIGAGIFNFDHSEATLNNSTLSDNSCDISGGGIHSETGMLILNNCTLSGNEADDGGGIYSFHSTNVFNNCTLSLNVSRNGGGLHITNADTTTLTNSIVAGNSASTSNNIYGSFSGTNNLVDGDPQLAPLGNYGGPTQTRPPLPGSPAIDAGGNTLSSSDQRGFARVVNGTVDIGAVEFQGASDIDRFWLTDWDGDGNPFGLEFALGMDWFTPDADDPANLAMIRSGGESGVAFGFNPAATNYAIWTVLRSRDLVNEPFLLIYRYDGPRGMTITNVPCSVTMTTNAIEVIDLSNPQPTAFYRLEIDLSP